MTYKPAYGVGQLDGTKYQGFNCMPWSDSKLVDRATQGRNKPSAPRIRTLAGDYSGGLNMTQVQAVDTKYYGFTPRKFMPIAWTDLMALPHERGFLLSIGYGPIAGTRYDCFRGRFKDNHAIYVQGRLVDGLDEADPGADGRYTGCPHGYQKLPFSLARQAAGALDLSGLGTSGYRPLGAGKAYVLLAPKDPEPVIDPIVWNHTVTVTKRDLAVRARPSSDSKRLAVLHKGQTRKCTKLRRYGGAYFVDGKRRTDWVGYTRLGRTVWMKRAWVKVIA